MIKGLRWELSESVLRALADTHWQVGRPNVPPAYAVMTSVTLVEVYVSDVLKDLVNKTKISNSTFGRALLDAVSQEFSRTWQDRYQWLKNGFGVAVAGDREAQAFETLVELRNSIAHGGGRLTDRQQADAPKVLALEKSLKGTLHVTSEAGRLTLAATTPAQAVSVSRAFVTHLDKHLPLG